MRNVRSESAIAALDRADVGVLAFTAKDNTPRACAVTPYVVDGVPTITATLALLTKVRMLRRRPAAGLLAGGTHVAGDTEVDLHRAPDWFDTHIRQREIEKYPPAKQLLQIPFHRRLLWWYVGRAAIAFPSPAYTSASGGDRVTITSVVDGQLQITMLAADLPTDGDEIGVGTTTPDGPGCLLVHEETDGMAELLQLSLRGETCGGTFRVKSRHGSLEPQNPGSLDQLRGLRHLAKAAKQNRLYLDGWTHG